jgi:hypothetical protein
MMTPQSFSYPTVGNDGIIYVPPYGLEDTLDYMLAINPVTYAIIKIPLDVNNSKEKWTFGTVVGDKIFWLPYGEERVLVFDTYLKQVSYINVAWPNDTEIIKGKYVQGHVYNNKIFALPYGEDQPLDYVLVVDLINETAELKYVAVPVNDCKKWHQSVLRGNKIYAVPRGAYTPFNFAI